MKGKVIDLLAKRAMKQQNLARNDEQTNKGTYIGHVHPETADMVRQSGIMLDSLGEQIDAMVEQWEHMALAHFGLIDQVLVILGANAYNPSTHTISVSEEGHVWIVPKEEDKLI